MANRLFDVLGSIVLVGFVTAMVLPGRQTPAVITAGGNAFSKSLGTAIKG